MRRARILHLRASNLVGGPEQQLLRYAQLERDSEFELILGSFVGPGEGSDFMRAAADRGLNTATMPASNLASSFHALVRVIHERKIKLLCAHGYKADILGIAAGRLAGIPVACFLRGWTGENRNVRLYEGADKFALFFADRIVCLSNLQRTDLLNISSLANKIRVISNAIDVPGIDGGSRIHARSELRRRLGLPPACRVVASGGRLSPEKGVGDFLQAISLIAAQFIDTRFVIFGEGALRLDLEKASRTLGIANQAVFAGFQRDLRGLLPGVDLLVNPSHSEEMPNIVLEAMAARVPVVATRVGGVEEISGCDGALRLVPPGKPTMLANEISLLLSDPALMNELGSAGQMRAKKSYSLDRQRSEFHAFYKELIARPRMKGSSDAAEIPLGASFS